MAPFHSQMVSGWSKMFIVPLKLKGQSEAELIAYVSRGLTLLRNLAAPTFGEGGLSESGESRRAAVPELYCTWHPGHGDVGEQFKQHAGIRQGATQRRSVLRKCFMPMVWGL